MLDVVYTGPVPSLVDRGRRTYPYLRVSTALLPTKPATAAIEDRSLLTNPIAFSLPTWRRNWMAEESGKPGRFHCPKQTGFAKDRGKLAKGRLGEIELIAHFCRGAITREEASTWVGVGVGWVGWGVGWKACFAGDSSIDSGENPDRSPQKAGRWNNCGTFSSKSN